MTNPFGPPWRRYSRPKHVAPTAANFRAGKVEQRELNELQLPGADLSQGNLSDKMLKRANFAGAVLVGADLNGSNLRGASFVNADLTGTVLRNCNLRGADFSGAKLMGTDFTGARLHGANLKSARISLLMLPATYDDTTVWPKDFDPLAAHATKAKAKKQTKAAKSHA